MNPAPTYSELIRCVERQDRKISELRQTLTRQGLTILRLNERVQELNNDASSKN